MKPVIIGIMGGGHASEVDLINAYRLGALIAEAGWIVLNGGRDAGIMHASAEGAKSVGGTTIGILPDDDCARVSRFIDIPILTGMGNGRNIINVLSSHVVVACPGGPGTLSEIALALKCNKPIITLGYEIDPIVDGFQCKDRINSAASPENAMEMIRKIIEDGKQP